jgi:hypothetical protein
MSKISEQDKHVRLDNPQTCGGIVPLAYALISKRANFARREKAVVAQRILILAAVIVVTTVWARQGPRCS